MTYIGRGGKQIEPNREENHVASLPGGNGGNQIMWGTGVSKSQGGEDPQ